jgi:hypothetical protein
VNDDDRWRGELLSPGTLTIRDTATVASTSSESSIEMKISPIMSCGAYTYVLLRSASGSQTSIDAFVFSDFPILRLEDKNNIATAGDSFISSACVPGSAGQSDGIILLMQSPESEGGGKYTLFLDSTLTASSKKPEEEVASPDQPNVNFEITSLQVLDSTQVTRLIFAYDSSQPQSANGALLGFQQPNPDTIAGVLTSSVATECPVTFYLSGGNCVECDGSDEAKSSCAIAESSSSNSLPAPVKVAIGVLIPFIAIFIAFLAYVYWRKTNQSTDEKGRSGANMFAGIKFLENG